MPRTEDSGIGVHGLVLPSRARPKQRQRLLILSLVGVLHLLLVIFLIAGLSLPRTGPPGPPALQVVLDVAHPQPPAPLPLLHLVRPERPNAAAPEIDIVLPPRPMPLTLPPAATKAGAAGAADMGTKVAGAPPAADAPAAQGVAPDPNCETVAAYTLRVRSAIARFFEYSRQARDARVQGEVVVHFLSGPKGQIQDFAITASSIERIYRGRTRNGHYRDLIVGFTRAGAASWTWQARVHPDTGADTVLGSGIVHAGDDGVLRATDRADAMMGVALPDGMQAQLPPLRFGNAGDLLLLEKSVQLAFKRAQPLPAIPACLKLPAFNAMMPFRFHEERGNAVR